MKKIYKYLLVLLLVVISSSLFFACNPIEELTDNEVISKAVEKMEQYFPSNKKVYYNIKLDEEIKIEEKYIVSIKWSSSNEQICNSQTGKINVSSEDQKFTLIARLTYKDEIRFLDYNLTIPKNVYINNNLKFNRGNEIRCEIKSLKIQNDKLSISIYLLNNLNSRKTIYGITKLQDFSINSTYDNLYLIKQKTCEDINPKRFTLKYGDYIELTLPDIDIKEMYVYRHLATTNFYFTVDIVECSLR